MFLIIVIICALATVHDSGAFRTQSSRIECKKLHFFRLAANKSGKKARSVERELREVLPGSIETQGLIDTGNTGDSDSDSDSDSDTLSKEQSAKIKAEISSPFRGIRKFAYIAMGAAGGLGTFTAVPQLFFAFQDGEDVGGALTNIAVDLGGIIGAIVLWDQESKAETRKVAAFTQMNTKKSAVLSKELLDQREREIGLLPVEIIFSESDENVTRIYKFADLQLEGGQSIVIVAGNKGYVRDCILSARLEGNSFFNDNDIYVVPVIMDVEEDNPRVSTEGKGEVGATLQRETAKGFGGQKQGILEAPYIGKAAQLHVWQRYLEKEFLTAEAQGAKNAYNQGLALVVSNTGKVARRGLGIPLWGQLLDDLNKKPSARLDISNKK